MKPLIIGVAGGSGSGKTTVVEHIVKHLNPDDVLLVQHDAYYRDLSHLEFEERIKLNFDHPSSLETELMIRHIEALTNGYAVEVPEYDFEAHTRKETTHTATPKKIILIDGILILTDPGLRDLMDVKVFVDTDDDIRLLRRLNRDILSRGRSVESVLEQYENFVRPMHLEFVAPSKEYADIIIPKGGHNTVAMEMVLALIQKKL